MLRNTNFNQVLTLALIVLLIQRDIGELLLSFPKIGFRNLIHTGTREFWENGQKPYFQLNSKHRTVPVIWDESCRKRKSAKSLPICQLQYCFFYSFSIFSCSAPTLVAIHQIWWVFHCYLHLWRGHLQVKWQNWWRKCKYAGGDHVYLKTEFATFKTSQWLDILGWGPIIY